jgi:hypothetical protein
MEHERGTMALNLTYDELAERLGSTRNAARVLAQRRTTPGRIRCVWRGM